MNVRNTTDEIRHKLADKGLKVTPQRIAILDALYQLGNHPTAENIIELIHKQNPNIASGTVYKVLDTLISNNLIKKVTTEFGIMRYDAVMEKHHHLYCSECDLIEDFKDEELEGILKDYFSKKKIEGFHIEDFEIQLRGTFDKC